MKKYILLLIIPFLSFGQTEYIKEYYESGKHVYIVQNQTKIFSQGENDVLEIQEEAFEIRFLIKRENPTIRNLFMLAAITSYDDFNAITIGQKINSISNFRSGTGMAMGADGTDTWLSFGSDGHHHLFYEQENHKRINFVERYEGIDEFKYYVDELVFRNDNDKKTDSFYLISIMDLNKNNTIDFGEITKLTIKLLQENKPLIKYSLKEWREQ